NEGRPACPCFWTATWRAGGADPGQGGGGGDPSYLGGTRPLRARVGNPSAPGPPVFGQPHKQPVGGASVLHPHVMSLLQQAACQTGTQSCIAQAFGSHGGGGPASTAGAATHLPALHARPVAEQSMHV